MPCQSPWNTPFTPMKKSEISYSFRGTGVHYLGPETWPHTGRSESIHLLLLYGQTQIEVTVGTGCIKDLKNSPTLFNETLRAIMPPRKTDVKGPLRDGCKSYRSWATECSLKKTNFVHERLPWLPAEGKQKESFSD